MGIDPSSEEMEDVLSHLDEADIDNPKSWDLFLRSINDLLEKSGRMPPMWRDYDKVLADYPGDKTGAEAAEDTSSSFGTPSLDDPDKVTSAKAVFEADFDVVESSDSEPPIEEEAVGWFSRKFSWLRWTHAVGTLAVLALILLIVKAVILDDTTKVVANEVPTATPTSEDPQDTDPPTETETSPPAPEPAPAPPPVEPETPPDPTPAPPPPEPEPAPAPSPPSGDTITVSCDVSRMLVGSCSDVPQGCQVGASKRPKIQASCGTETYCSQYGGPAAAPTGDGISLTLRTSWCD